MRVWCFHLFALCGFAIAAPLLDALQRHPELLVAHGAAASTVWALTSAVVLVPPLILFALECAVALASRAAARSLHAVLMGALVALTLLCPLAGVAWDPVALESLACLGGILFAAAYVRFMGVRSAVTLLAAAPLVFSISFLTREGVKKLLAGTAQPNAAVVEVGRPAPVVLLIFDGLPLASILRDAESIDDELFPNFAALAGESTWYRHTHAVADETALAVPAILTGRLPRAGLLPIASDHPENLFTLLGGSYAMEIHEARTLLDPGRGSQARRDAPGDSWLPRPLLSDLAVVYGHLVLPRPLATSLPRVDRDWRDFSAPDPAEFGKVSAKARYGNRLRSFQGFVDRVGDCMSPCLYFLHSLLPHVPWVHMPSGEFYAPPDIPGLGPPKGVWGDDPWWIAQGYQRHLFQVVLADRLLGELVAELRRYGIYDRALVVVTADHGASFWPNQSRRKLVDHRHPEDILRVPLFVKSPGQRSGRVDDRGLETIDVLPTIADHLQLHIPWPVDGRSALGDRFSRDVVVSHGPHGRTFVHATDELAIDASVERKHELFPKRVGEDKLFAIGDHWWLVGRDPSEFPIESEREILIEVAEQTVRAGQGPPPRLTGRVRLAAPTSDPPHLVFSVRGRIRSVAPTFATDSAGDAFSVFLPEHGGVAEDLDVFALMGTSARPVLVPAHVEAGPILGELRVGLLRAAER
ncbi:MAG: sulfatase-like hydrolase/transferase [Myxococcota bacterium]